MVENSAEVMIRQYIAESPEPASSEPLDYRPHKAIIWSDFSCVAINLIPSHQHPEQPRVLLPGRHPHPHHSHLDPTRVDKLSFPEGQPPPAGSLCSATGRLRSRPFSVSPHSSSSLCDLTCGPWVAPMELGWEVAASAGWGWAFPTANPDNIYLQPRR